jgi:hypothetical protein
MKEFVFGLVVFCGSISWGQCPLKLNEFDPSALWGADKSLFNEASRGQHETMVIHATNISAKDIAAVDFRVTFVDATLTDHEDLLEKFEWAGNVKQGKDMKKRWDRPLIYVGGYPYARINVLKVLFADDSPWLNDGTCKELWDKRYLKKHKVAE